jgi:glycosyltransferase involved in cell wall biosynthesis
MANYNNGHFIKSAVNSVLNQTCKAWELLIVDDGSEDNSVSVIRSMAAADSRIRYLQNDRNRGVGCTKRRLVENCRGDMVAVLDPDDTITEDALAVMWAAHTHKPEASLCWSEHWICDEFLNVITKSSSNFGGDSFAGYIFARSGDIHHFWTFKRDAYFKTSGFDPSFRLAEDQDLFYKLEEIGATHHVDKPLYKYRQHSGSISIGDKRAAAFACHLVAMCAALRRRKSLISPEIWEKQRQVVWRRYKSFLEWGVPKIELALAMRVQHSITSVVELSWSNSVLKQALRYRLGRASKLLLKRL